jgi:hypothetical protein
MLSAIGPRRLSHAWPLFVASIIVVMIYGLIACTADSELGSRTASEAYYNRLADGLAKGTLSLALEAPKALVDLPDPYDRNANSVFRGHLYGPGRLHDLSFYHGKLYLYFSMIPALLLFLPYHAITGGYLSHQQACFVFSSLGFAASALLLDSIRRRCFPKSGLATRLLATLCVGLVPLIPIFLQRPDVWEVPIAASYTFWMLSFLILWGYLSRPLHSWPLLACLSLTVGLAIGCRPDSILAGVVLLLPAGLAVLDFQKNRNVRTCVSSLLALTLPLAAIGIGLAAYNYSRFGNVFEFGQKYQLNEDIATYEGHFRLRFFWYDFRLYFLEYPGWTRNFPFVKFLDVSPAPPGFGMVFGPVGVLTLLPFTLFAFAAPFAFKRADPGQSKELQMIVAAIFVAFLCIAGPLCFFFGAVDRYQVEFVPALVLLAVIGLFALEARISGHAAIAKGVRAVSCLLAVASIGFNLLMTTATRALTLSFRGDLAAAGHQWETATTFYKRSLRLAPSKFNPMLRLGVCLVQEGRLADASDELGRVVALYPESADAHLEYALDLYFLRRFDEAAAECREALRLNPDLPGARQGLQTIEAAQKT